ncbi:hypothetical protein GCM10023189_00410 [Nibrella saemangeumensis]|uniref:Uncharacterized protein n=1 Tax=Nibrella saemangeumensis TaxID=1084526 RepID=A0ABP8M7J4_9BACT
MPEHVRLYPECHADTALITFFVPDSRIIEHAAGINEVSKALQQVQKVDTTLIGIVDNDKHKPRYLDLFKTVAEENKICFRHRPGSNQYLIIIDKAIETFLLWNAGQVGISISDYGFEPAIRNFGLRLKRRDIETEPDYLRLLSDLYTSQAPGFLTLERILNDFITT